MKWIPVTERLPESMKDVFVFGHTVSIGRLQILTWEETCDGYDQYAWYDYVAKELMPHNADYKTITHWAEISEPDEQPLRTGYPLYDMTDEEWAKKMPAPKNEDKAKTYRTYTASEMEDSFFAGERSFRLRNNPDAKFVNFLDWLKEHNKNHKP